MLDETKSSILRTVVPWTRPYLRYAPLSLGKPYMVRLFKSYVYRNLPRHEALSSTIFGARTAPCMLARMRKPRTAVRSSASL